MRKIFAAMLALMLVTAVAAQDTGRVEPVKPEAEKKDEAKETGIQFLHNLDEAKKQAAEEKKKLFIVFSTAWCGPCKMLKEKVWSKAEIAERVSKEFVSVYLDGDKEADAKKLFAVKAYPTIILAEADCKVLATEVGAGGKSTANAWVMWIDEKLGQSGKLGELVAAVEKQPDDAAALRALADAYYELGRKDDAAAMYGRAEAVVEEELIQIKLRRCELLMGKLKDDPTVREVLEELIPKLLKKKDERVIDISLSFANIIARMAEKKDPAKGREMMLALQEAFPESKRMVEFRCHAGMYAHQNGDNETALAEMKKIAEDYKDSEDETTKIWVDRCARFIKTVEGGGKYR